MSEQSWGGQILPLLERGIEVKYLGGRYYKLDFPRIEQVAAAERKNYPVPFPHSIINLYVKHLNASLINSETLLTFNTRLTLRDNITFEIAEFSSVEYDEMFTYPSDQGIMSAADYEFNVITTVGHFTYISMIIKAGGGS